MSRIYIKFTIMSVILISFILYGFISLGRVFPSQWVFTTNRAKCMFACYDRSVYDLEFDVALIDGDRNLEYSLLTADPEHVRGHSISPNGQHIVQIRSDMTDKPHGLRMITLHGNDHIIPLVEDQVMSSWVWSTDSQTFYFTYGNELYRYEFPLDRLILIYSGSTNISRSIVAENLNYVVIELANGELYRQHIYNPDDLLLLSQEYENVRYGTLAYSGNGVIAYVRANEVQIVNLVDGELIDSITNLPLIFSIEWSPDGTWLTILSDNEDAFTIRNMSPRQVYNFNIEERRIYSLEPDENVSSYAVFWSSNSQHIVLRTFHDVSGIATYNLNVTDPFFDSSSLQIEDVSGYPDLVWMPDRPVLFYRKRIPSNSIYPIFGLYAVNITEPSEIPLFIDEYGSYVNYFNDNEIVYTRSYDGHDRLFVFNLDTRQNRPLTSSPYNIYSQHLWSD